MKHHLKLFLLFFLFIPICLSAQSKLEKLKFAPQWTPQAQFAGYYVALDQGFYKDAGIDVEIIHPSASVSAFDYLKNGSVDAVSSFLIDGLKQRAQGNSLVNFAQLSQHSALMMVAKKESGIKELKDINGKKLGIWSSGFDDIPLALIQENNYSVDIVRILGSINLFLVGGIDLMTVMQYNEYDQIINSGVNEDELNTFFFADYGFDIPEDGLYCLESTLKEKANALKKFTEATLKGWEYASKNKEYTINLVVTEMDKAHLPNNKAHQCWMLERMLELIEPNQKNVKKGQLLDRDFYRALSILKSNTDLQTDQMDIQIEEFYKPVIK